MNEGMEERVAVLGLGIIGSRALDCIGRAGWKVVGWNRTPKGLANEVLTAEEAVEKASIVAMYLKDSPATREVLARLKPLLGAGMTVINHATLDLETTQWIAALCDECGCQFLDAPFTGSKLAAADGQLVYYVGGDAELAGRLDGFLALTSKSRIATGGIGSATVVKLATNLISACTVQAMAESLAISIRHGVSPQCLMDAVGANVSGSRLTAMKFPLMLAGDYETHFSMDNMAKDSRYMLELAHAAGLETPGIAAVSSRMIELCEKGLGELDFSAVAKPYLDGR